MLNKLIQQVKDWMKFQALERETNRNIRNFKRSCALADKMRKGDNKTRYVIKSSQGWTILSTDEIDVLKRKNLLKQGVTIYDILQKAHYISSSNNGLVSVWEREKYKQLKK